MCRDVSPFQSQAMWAQTGWGRELSAGGSGVGKSGRGLWVCGDFGLTGFGYSTYSVVKTMLLKKGDL